MKSFKALQTKEEVRTWLEKKTETIILSSAIIGAITERLWAQVKGRDPENDAKINQGFQLTEAAQRLVQYKIQPEEAWYPPNNWSEELWKEYVNRPYLARLQIAAGLLIAEAERVDYLTEKDLPVIPKLTIKPQEDEGAKATE